MNTTAQTIRPATEGETCTTWNAWEGTCGKPAVRVSEGEWSHENWKSCQECSDRMQAVRQMIAKRREQMSA